MQVCFFEDETLSRFHPLTLTRPVDELRCGALTIREKWLNFLNTSRFSRSPREPVTEYYPENPDPETGSVVWINSRCLPDSSLAKEISELAGGSALKKGEVVIAARTENVGTGTPPEFADLTPAQSEHGTLLDGATDLFLNNGREITRDFQWFSGSHSSTASISSHAVLEGPEDRIFTGADSAISPLAVIDTTGGPVIIQEGAKVMSSSYVQGPAAIGPGSVVKAGTRYYKESTLGPVCKVGGEVSNIIIQGYSNKAHDGYLGNSVIGEWCNLGADTTASNLKNNYGLIKLRDWESGDLFNTGLQFCGTLMGDHTKTTIHAMLNTGSQFGVNCNILAGRFPPTFLPSFSWVGTDQIYTFQIDKSLETARRVMSRRGFELTPEYERMLRRIFESSK